MESRKYLARNSFGNDIISGSGPLGSLRMGPFMSLSCSYVPV